MTRIKVSRDSGYADRIRKYKVICNGKCVGQISNGETLSLDVDSGYNEIYLKIDWCRSNKIKVNTTPDETLVLNGGSNIRGSKIFLALIYTFFLPHKYLWLKSETS